MSAITELQIDQIKNYITTVLPQGGMTGNIRDKVAAFAVKHAGIKTIDDISESQAAEMLDLFSSHEPVWLVRYVEESLAPKASADTVTLDVVPSAKRTEQRESELTFFESIALPLISRGWKVAPCYPKQKQVHTVLVPRPLEMQSNDSAQTHAWGLAEPNANVCVYAEQVEGGLCFVDKDGDISLIEKFERETGKKFPQTLLVQSSVAANGTPKGHWYFLQTPRTVALEKNISENKTGGLFSLRVKNEYVTSIGSIHPTGQPYKIADDVSIIPMPDDFLDWLLAQVKDEPKTREQAQLRGKFTKGTRYPALISEIGRLWSRGYSRELTISTGLEWARENFDIPEDAFDEKLVGEEIEHFLDYGYPQGQSTDVILNQKPTNQPFQLPSPTTANTVPTASPTIQATAPTIPTAVEERERKNSAV